MRVEICKAEDERLVFGWANVSVRADGEQVVDAHDDMIDPDVLEKAAYEFVLNFGNAGEMHQGGTVGRLVESFMATPDKAEAMGLSREALPVGLWVGFKIDDAGVWEKIKSGEYPAFSIQGMAVREPVE